MDQLNQSIPRQLANRISDLMTLAGATLSEHQEDMMFFALRTLVDEEGKVQIDGKSGE